MSRKKIFLSYRRDDSPGYVARLEDDLEYAFGAERVFRDVEDISGGAQWREVLEENLAISGALVLVIGPHWADIWRTRADDEVNYVAFELERARELGIPVIPVTLNQASVPRDLDLGSVAWLHDTQSYNISDVQGRWPNDVQGLIQNLAALPAIGPPIAHDRRKPRVDGGDEGRRKTGQWLGIALAVVALGGAALWIAGKQNLPDDLESASQSIAAKPAPADMSVETRSSQTADFPNISGTWISQKDGTAYIVTQRDDGSFSVNSPGYGRGEGAFIPNMPRKFRVEMYDIGRGEFAVSNSDDDRAIGWLLNYQSSRKEYDTLQRVR
ncbi:MAG: toll/interleukin-1 receptor domain-containing protein [Gammaproteobacteria bacterium]|jgi:hypothetical protein